MHDSWVLQVLKQDDKSVRRRFQRQLKAKDKLLTEAAIERAQLKAQLTAIQADLKSMQAQSPTAATAAAAATSKNGQSMMGAASQALQLQRTIEALQEEAAQQRLAKDALQKGAEAQASRIADLERQVGVVQQETQQQKAKAAAMYLELQQDSQQEVLKLKSEIFDLKMRGHG